MPAIAGLPGWRHEHFQTIGSTNIECLSRAEAGDEGRLWITAAEQVAGKGRRGNHWVSETGNLYASVLLIDRIWKQRVTTLPFVAALAAHDAIGRAAEVGHPDLSIKWPNDILWQRRKLAGILLERTPFGDQQAAIVVGFGINCTHSPSGTPYPTTSIREMGRDVSADDLLPHLAKAFAETLAVWEQPNGFEVVRSDWLNRASGLGEKISVRLPAETLTGIFHTIDSEGQLQLFMDNKTRSISAGEVFFPRMMEEGAG
ncbi:MAG: biotin--[acetyl-CoA-carboxylase] ligase [Pseudomonadota bacterium]